MNIMSIIRPLIGVIFGLILRQTYEMVIAEQVPFELLVLMTCTITIAVIFGIIIGLIF